MKFCHYFAATALFALAACGVPEASEADEALDETTVAEIEDPALGVDETESDEATAADPDSNIPDTPNPQVEFIPVRYGFDGPEMDACGSYGEVTGLNPEGDNYLSVRASPFVGGYELDRLEPGQGVSMCDYKDGWVGIVYDKEGETDCGTGSPIPEVRDYDKPCSSGWVSEDFVTLIAG